MYWDVLECTGLYWNVLGCTGRLLGGTGMYMERPGMH